MRWLAILLCTCACRQLLGFEEAQLADAPLAIDAAPDVPPIDAQQCFGVPEVGVAFCLVAAPSGVIAGDQALLDTGRDDDQDGPFDCAALMSDSSDVCVVAAESIAILAGDTVVASGGRPLVLLATTMVIAGTLDAASRFNGLPGPAAGLSSVGCDPGTPPTQGAGGQGGSFATKGGNGGDQHSFGGSAGIAGDVAMVTTFRGGCPGEHGAQNANSRGAGGGAVMLIASDLTMGAAATINASGASGEGAGPTDNGGGGAGSGGMIVIVSPSIAAAGQVFANGGRGGGGSSDTTAGESGVDPIIAMSGGTGGNGGDSAGDGGPGFPAGSPNGTAGTANGDGGGGGGGGAGIIRVLGGGSLSGAAVSPPPS